MSENRQLLNSDEFEPVTEKENSAMPSFIEQPNGVFPSVCPLDCPDQCGLLVHKKDGKIIKVEGDVFCKQKVQKNAAKFT